jgi:hypothetical protein
MVYCRSIQFFRQELQAKKLLKGYCWPIKIPDTRALSEDCVFALEVGFSAVSVFALLQKVKPATRLIIPSSFDWNVYELMLKPFEMC